MKLPGVGDGGHLLTRRDDQLRAWGAGTIRKKSVVVEISNWEQQMHGDGSAPWLRYTVVCQEPSPGLALRGVQCAAPGSAGGAGGAGCRQRGPEHDGPGCWSQLPAAAGSGSTACAPWRMPLLFLEYDWGFLT